VVIDGRMGDRIALIVDRASGPDCKGSEMTLLVLTVVVITLLIAALAIFLFALGASLNRTADNLDDCAQNVKNIAHQAEVIGPAIERINETGGTVVGALPLLSDAAERIGVAKSAPYADPSEAPYSAPSAAPTVTSEASYPPHSAVPAAVSAASPQGVGYLDGEGRRGSLGYLDA
jgi:HAMP domain-containing protein